MFTEIVEKVSSNVVRVDVNINGQWENGTGIVIDSKGTILTCEHVVRPNGINAQSISVTKKDEMPKQATLVNTDSIHDLATIQINELKISEPLKQYNYDKIKIGQDCFVLGYPIGLNHLTLTKSVISAKGRGLINKFQFDTIQIDARVNQGNSGGPIFTNEGEIIDIVTMKYIPFFEKIQEIRNYVNSIPFIQGDILLPGSSFSITKFINGVNEE